MWYLTQLSSQEPRGWLAGSTATYGKVTHAYLHLYRLERLVSAAVHLLGDDRGGTNEQLEALSPHVLDKHGQVQLPAAADLMKFVRNQNAPL